MRDRFDQLDGAIVLWLSPLRLVGESDSKLCVSGPRQIADWDRRRYAKTLAELVRELSDFDGILIWDDDDKETR